MNDAMYTPHYKKLVELSFQAAMKKKLP